jgi:ankyrin repeat protein
MRCLAKSFDLSEFLLKAAQTEQCKLVHLLLEANVKINKELELHAENNIKQLWNDKYFGRAVFNGGLVLVSIRLGNLHWDEKLFHGKTALQYTVSHNWVDAVDAFIEAGADKDTKNDEGYTPLHYSVFSNYSQIAKMLIASGANLDIKDNYGRTALHLSVSNHHPNITKKLIDNDADKNVQDDSKSTPLHIAISENSHIIVKMLIESGASKYIEDTSGFTAIDLSKSCSREISRMLNEKNRANLKSKKNFKQHMCCIII